MPFTQQGLICHKLFFVVIDILFLFCRHHIPIISFSILFAEGFPARWEENGKARIVLTQFWNFATMFIVLIYLCNLRSHLIRGIKEKPIQSYQELLDSDLHFTRHDGAWFDGLLKKAFGPQGRYTETKGKVTFKHLVSMVTKNEHQFVSCNQILAIYFV